LNEAAAYKLAEKVAQAAERNERQAELSRMLALWKLETRLTVPIGCTPNAILCVVWYHFGLVPHYVILLFENLSESFML